MTKWLAVVLMGLAGCAEPMAPTAPLRVQPAIEAAPPRVPVVPGLACVTDLRRDAAWRLTARTELADESGELPTEEEVAARLFDSMIEDLDGDGVDDTVLAVDFGVKAAVQALYATGDGCMRFVGVIVDSELSPSGGSSHGLRDIEAYWAAGCAGHVYRWTRYRFDGERYVESDQADCDFCPADERDAPLAAGANQHPHCQQELARRAPSSETD